MANKPDIGLMDRAQPKVFPVDVTLLFDENLTKSKSDKMRYLNMSHKNTDIWQVTSDLNLKEVVLVAFSTNRLIKNKNRNKKIYFIINKTRYSK